VLTVTKLGNAEYLIGSVALGVEEYYLGVGEAPGVWAGRWADELGLEGVVEADDLRSLIEGRHPVTGVDLVAKQRHREVRAIDLTFSAPKSVSVLWALGSDNVHSVVMGAHRDAVAAALGFLEARAAGSAAWWRPRGWRWPGLCTARHGPGTRRSTRIV